jgi:hypothetical protein
VLGASITDSKSRKRVKAVVRRRVVVGSELIEELGGVELISVTPEWKNIFWFIQTVRILVG